jgi:hypothetical protein
MSPNPANQTALQTFDQFVAAQENGDLNHDLSEMLRETVATLNNFVQDHGGKPKASITIKLGFLLDGGIVHCEAEIDNKLPKAPRNGSIYFSTADNKLSRRDPRQHEMFQDVNQRAAGAPVTV